MYYFHFAVTVRPVRPVSPAEPRDLLKHATRCQDVHSRVGNGMASLTTFPHILSLLKMDSQPGIILNISTIILIIILNHNISPLTKLTSNKKNVYFPHRAANAQDSEISRCDQKFIWFLDKGKHQWYPIYLRYFKKFWYCSDNYEDLRELFWEPDWKENPESTFNGNRHGMNHKNQNTNHNVISIASYPAYMLHNHPNPGTMQRNLWWTSGRGEVCFLLGLERSGMGSSGLGCSKCNSLIFIKLDNWINEQSILASRILVVYQPVVQWKDNICSKLTSDFQAPQKAIGWRTHLVMIYHFSLTFWEFYICCSSHCNLGVEKCEAHVGRCQQHRPPPAEDGEPM